MLELFYKLARNLRARGLLDDNSSHLVRCRQNGTGLWIRLTAQGAIQEITALPPTASYLCFGGSTLFPAFNVLSLVQPPEGFSAPSIAERTWLAQTPGWTFTDAADKLQQRWRSTALNVQQTCAGLDGFPPALLRLAACMLQTDRSSLVHDLLAKAAETVAAVPETLPAWLALVGVGESAKEQRFLPLPARNKLFLVVEDGTDVSAAETWEQASAVLAHANVGDSFEATCALTGVQGPCVVHHPIVQVPHYGKIQLFSVNKENRIGYFYGRSEGRVFPVSTRAAADMTRAIQYLWTRDNKYETWSPVPRPQPVKKKAKKLPDDVLLSWVEEHPELPTLPLLDVDPDREDCAFKLATEKVFAALDQRLVGEVPAHVEVGLLRQLDKANYACLFSERFDLSELRASIENWQVQADGLAPRQCFPFFAEHWLRQGTERRECVCRFDMSDIYRLYLRLPGHEALARTLLTSLLRTHGMFFVANRRNKKEQQRFTRGQKLLWLLLRKQGVENMESVIGKLGRVLSAYDQLQRWYARDEQGKKELPGQSVSESCLEQLLANPTYYYRYLVVRCKVYLSWAKRRGLSDTIAQAGLLTDEEVAGLPARLSVLEQAVLVAAFTHVDRK
jgi:hypothetical protein